VFTIIWTRKVFGSFSAETARRRLANLGGVCCPPAVRWRCHQRCFGQRTACRH